MTGFEDIQHANLTDVGVRRSHNQDNHAILLATDEQQWRTRGHVFLVADGMGAHAVGELASALAVGIIPHTYDKYASQGTSGALRKAFVEANTSIHNRGQQNREFAGMGTTATALVLRPEGAWVAHVGDSRAYRIRDGHIEQLSFDHSMVWEFARRQHMDPAQVQGIPSNVIFRSLGPEPLVPVDIEGVHPLRVGDVFLLCSDGLSGQVTDAEMGAVASVLLPEPACRFLVDLANHRGGPDNITVIVVRIGRKLATPPPVKRAWYHRVPWSLVALFLGVVLSGGAVALALYQMLLPAGLAFGLAVVTLLAGVIGLIVYHSREKKRATEEADRPQPKIHRSQSCRIDRLLIDKMARTVQDLKQLAQDKACEIDSIVFETYLETAQNQNKAGNLVSAFREYCLASQVLMTALKTQQAKTEVFQPNWDKREVPKMAAGGGNGRDREAYRCEHCGKVKGPSGDWNPPVCCERPMTKLS